MAYGNVSRAAFGIFVAYLCFATYQWFTLYLARRKFIIKEGCKPIQGHYPHTDKILGTDYLRDAFAAKAKGELLIRESGLFDRLGATYMFRVFGMGVISTAEPENIKAIFATKFNDFSTGERNRVLEPLLGTGIFTTDGDLWAHSRVMIRPNFTRSQISDLNRLEAHVQELFQLIPPDGHEVDLQPLFFRLMMDSATDFLFGQSAHSLREEIKPTPGRPSGTAFAHAFDLAQEYCNVRFLYGPVGRIMWQPKEDRDAIATCRSFVEPYVDEAVRYRQDLDAGRIQDKGDDVKKQYTFLYELAKETKDRIRLRDEVMNLLVAGRDTTASFLSNLFHHLAKRPEIWTRLRDEVATLDGALPTFEQLKNMKYLQQCIKECKLSLPSFFKGPVTNITLSSSSIRPSSSGPGSRIDQRYSTTHGRWSGWQITSLHQKGYAPYANVLRHAQAQGPVWSRFTPV